MLHCEPAFHRGKIGQVVHLLCDCAAFPIETLMMASAVVPAPIFAM
jgi:hypothetical protein